MVRLGYIMLVAGFLTGAYATALDVESVAWPLFLPSAVVAALGLGIVKRSARSASQAEHVLAANRTILESSLDRIINEVEAIAKIRRESSSLTTDDLRGEIDSRLREDFRQFVEVRESLIHLYGIQAYADVMSEFAAGERNINRVWSASTDGYGTEADNYLSLAATRLRTARERLSSFPDAA